MQVDELAKDITRAVEFLDHHYVFTATELKAFTTRMHVKPGEEFDIDTASARLHALPGHCSCKHA